jgi:uncharacterized protein (DUF2267 family)
MGTFQQQGRERANSRRQSRAIDAAGTVFASIARMEPSSDSDVLRRLRELGPFAEDAEALRALRATLETLASHLTPTEREFLADALPPHSAQIVREASSAAQGSLNDFFRRVAAHEGVRLGLAVEHAEIVCRALGQTLTHAVLARLGHALPDLAPLFEPTTEPAPQLAQSEPAPDVPSDLAEGRPGGTHPLATADPLVLAHRHSVARSDDPHAETKLSSACGLTQEREARTLATGRPGSKRPISGSH